MIVSAVAASYSNDLPLSHTNPAEPNPTCLNRFKTARGILDYFAPAVQIGLTATPKRRNNVDSYAYFGEPAYTYSLKEGINDGYLTPFKVVDRAIQ